MQEISAKFFCLGMDTYYGYVDDPLFKESELPVPDLMCLEDVKRLQFQAVSIRPKNSKVSPHDALFSKHTSFSEVSELVQVTLHKEIVPLFNFGNYAQDKVEIFQVMLTNLTSLVKSLFESPAIPDETMDKKI